MSEPYLEVTFRQGRPLAGYYYLPRLPNDRAVRTEADAAGLVVDYASDGRAIGIEITAPAVLSLTAMNRLLRSLGQAPVKRAELLPVLAA